MTLTVENFFRRVLTQQSLQGMRWLLLPGRRLPGALEMLPAVLALLFTHARTHTLTHSLTHTLTHTGTGIIGRHRSQAAWTPGKTHTGVIATIRTSV
jgi:hypothetical protein